MSFFICSTRVVASSAVPGQRAEVGDLLVRVVDGRRPPAPGNVGIFSALSWSTILSVSLESTTRSGWYFAIASALGL